ncbi:hypothetical protein ACQEVI_23430 [Promicromonospora sp. CA-289599]|uniref:hypothetical protein n=1 Tax=Promicromonospora sp. CA-289599 TaxID=3240014 RepID=UPI003D9298A4
MSENISFWTGIIVAVATVIGVVFAGWQLLQYRRDQRANERMETEGVSLMWKALARPIKADFNGVDGLWVLEFTLTNPGRMPIDDITCRVTFEQEIRQVRYDGTLGNSIRTLYLNQEVLAGSSTRSWKRKFVTRFVSGALPISAIVDFTDARREAQTTTWPRSRTRLASPALMG